MKHRELKLLPQPLLSLFLLVIWLFVNSSIAVSTIFFGAILGWVIPLFSVRFWPAEHRHVLNHRRFALYILIVLKDIALANLNVARLILGSSRKLRPAFVTIPLELEHNFAITLLASTVSITPGTVSADVSADHKFLLVHALDVDNEEALIEDIKRRYETPIREIFK